MKNLIVSAFLSFSYAEIENPFSKRELSIEEMLADDMPFVFIASDFDGMFTALQADSCDGNYMLTCGKEAERDIRDKLEDGIQVDYILYEIDICMKDADCLTYH